MIAEGAALFDLSVDGGKARPVVIKEQQLHPVRGTLRHIDLQEVNLEEAIQADVTDRARGRRGRARRESRAACSSTSPARSPSKRCRPTIPDKIIVDVSAMEINDTLQLSAIEAPSGVTFVVEEDEEVTIATLAPPRVEEAAPEVEEETELVGEIRVATTATPRATATRAATPRASSPPWAVSLFGRRQGETASRILIVGLGNPGPEHARDRHNIGFDVARELARRWDLGKPRSKYKGELWEGRAGPGGPRVAILLPLTYMNAVGDSAGPARGALKAPLDQTIVLHDEIDIPFGEIRVREGGGLAGHNGLKSLKRGFGSADFWRVRIGVGRPDSTDPEIVSAWVLGKFREPPDRGRSPGRRRRPRDRTPGRATSVRGRR